jgi:hypothetical protein
MSISDIEAAVLDALRSEQASRGRDAEYYRARWPRMAYHAERFEALAARFDQLAAEIDWHNEARRTPDPTERMRTLLAWHHEHGGRCYADTLCTGCHWDKPGACGYTRIIRRMRKEAVTADAPATTGTAAAA